MKGLCGLLFCFAGLFVEAVAQTVAPKVEITGTLSAHEVRWLSRPGYCYSVECSPDLQTWTDLQILKPGTGDWITYGFSVSQGRMYYRVREQDMGFFIRPLPAEQCAKEDGVIFAFNLNALTQMPAKICISKRANAAAPWQLIGTLTDFTTLKGVKTVRGPSVWLPQETGGCEVKATAKTAAGAVLSEATRQISIFGNTPPAILVTGYSSTPDTGTFPYGTFGFTTVVSDPDPGDEVTRVEFCDRVLTTIYEESIGTDFSAPFGALPTAPEYNDGLVNMRGDHYFRPNRLLKGDHEIYAKAYDSRGGVTISPRYDYNDPLNGALRVDIPDGLVRPSLAVWPPNAYMFGYQGNSLALSYAVLIPPGMTNGGLFEPQDSLDGGTSVSGYGANQPNGTMTWNTGSWEPGGHVFAATARIFLYIPQTYERTFNARLDSSQWTNADVMALMLTDPNSAPSPNQNYTAKIYGSYGACQPYTGGNAAGLDASTPAPRQMDTGVLLTTGKGWQAGATSLIPLWKNTNDTSEGTSYQWSGIYNQSPSMNDLVMYDKIPGTYIRDACTLEFDVDCVYSQLEMEIQYGSEEYPERIGVEGGLAYDSLAITVDGTLISLTPDGGDAISAKSIHPFIPSSQSGWAIPRSTPALRDYLYLDDDAEINAAANSTTQVEFDGMTVRMRLHAFVTPGLHKIRISVADRDYPDKPRGDQAQIDSGVFVRSGSIRTIPVTP